MRYARPALLAIALLWFACSKHSPPSGAAHGTEIGVWVYETFPPASPGSPVRFRLSADELARIAHVIPDVSTAEDHACKCGVPRFGIELFQPGAARPFAEGHFFHGPDELTLTFDDRDPGRLHGQQAFHDALVAAIQARGYWPR
jgi:hypothetical protein